MLMLKTSYGLVQLLAVLLVRKTLAVDYNTAVFPTCDTVCHDTQRAGLMALYGATQVKNPDLRVASHLLQVAASDAVATQTGWYMDNQLELGLQCRSL